MTTLPEREKGASHILIFLLVLVVFGILVFLLTQSPDKLKQAVQPSSSQPAPKSGQEDKNNPYTAVQEMDRAREDYNMRLQKAGIPTPTKANYRFEYELSPELEKTDPKQSSFVRTTYAAGSICSVTSAPNTLTAYSLASHISAQQASEIARKFNITADPSSLPDEGGSFQYYFTNPQTQGFLTLNEASGTYTAHTVISSVGADIGQATAQQKAENQLQELALGGSPTLIDSRVETGANAVAKRYIFRYTLDWGGMRIFDEQTLKSINSSALCNLDGSTSMNFAEIHLAQDGTVANALNQSRIKLSTYPNLPRQSLKKSLTEYGSNPPVTIVKGGNVSGGKVQLTDASLALWDLDQLHAQYSYIPSYVTYGTVKNTLGQEVEVWTVFPAISNADLEAAGVIKRPQTSSLQLAKFNPKPPGSTDGSGCPGHTIVWRGNCSVNGSAICSTFAVQALDERDPNHSGQHGQGTAACDHSSQSFEGAINVAAGEDACAKFLFLNGIDPSTGGAGGRTTGRSSIFSLQSTTGQTATCSITGQAC